MPWRKTDPMRVGIPRIRPARGHTYRHERSPRKFPEKLRAPDYDLGAEVRTIRHNGEFKFKSNHYFLSELLVGEKVGLVEAADGKYEIRFGFHPIGMLDIRLGKVEPKSKKV